MQEIYTNYSDIKYFKSSINKIFSEVQDAVNFKYLTKENIVKKVETILDLRKKLNFQILSSSTERKIKLCLI